MTFALPPVVKLAESFCVQMEQAVRRFSRYYKFTVGTELRLAAIRVAEIAHRAWRERASQSEWTKQLVEAIDTLQLRMQIARQLRVFASGAQFDAMMVVVVDLGRQAGGWHRQQKKKHPKGPNLRTDVCGECAQILSTSAASREVKP